MKTNSSLLLVFSIGCLVWAGIVLVNAITDKITWKIVAAGIGFVLFGLLAYWSVRGFLKSREQESHNN